jgi:hypothetical protein
MRRAHSRRPDEKTAGGLRPQVALSLAARLLPPRAAASGGGGSWPHMGEFRSHALLPNRLSVRNLVILYYFHRELLVIFFIKQTEHRAIINKKDYKGVSDYFYIKKY